MNRTKLLINEIRVEDRQRIDLGDIDDLAASLARYGLIQPIVVSQDKRLVAGGRRIAAAIKLGWQDIDVVFKEALTSDVLHEMELEENVRRKEMSWQERTLNIEQIHRLKKQRNAAEGAAWGQRETAELLGVSVGNVNYCLAIARRLRADKTSPMWECGSLSDAWRLLIREEEDKVNATLALESQQSSLLAEYGGEALATVETAEGIVKVDYDAEREKALEQYKKNPLNDLAKFDEYWEYRKQRIVERENTMVISTRFHLCDSIEFMNARPGLFDHIVTDIPYGIDLDMLEQNNPHMGMNDIDTVEVEHDEEENKELMQRFFPAAFKATKENSFVVTWCDQMLWQYMYDLATAAGFRVQRWPITWVKTHSCMNSAAAYNFTKSTEIAMVCRKPGATLVDAATTCVVVASGDEMRKAIGHPFAKPFEVWKFILDKVAFSGQTILEPFSGRGSGVVSMIRLGFNVVGCEINTAHYNALLENVKTEYRTRNPNYIFK